MKFMTLVFMATAMILISCDKDEVEGPIGPPGPQGEQGIQGPEGPQGPAGEDGEALGVPGPQGPAGPPGADGADGTNGTDGADGANGADGADGNANVIASSWTNLSFPSNWDGNNEARFELPDARITQEVIDSYALLSYVKFSSNSTSASSVPFVSLGGTYEIHDAMSVGEYVAFAIGYDLGARPSPPANHQVRYVLIAPSSLSGKNNAPSLEKMKLDGVNTGNYYEVMDYLGLDD